MCTVKLYQDRDRWRVRIIDTTTNKKSNKVYATKALAQAAAERLRREYVSPVGVTLDQALIEYAGYLATKPKRQNKARTIETTLQRLRSWLGGLGSITGDWTPDDMKAAWEAYLASSHRAVDTQVGILSQTKTFFNWLVRKGHMRTSPLAGADIEAAGKRNRGKEQLTVDEARRFQAKALELAKAGDRGAVGGLCALLLGMRASELANRTVRHLDDNGRRFLIRDTGRDDGPKTKSGNRGIQLPDILQPFLQELVKGKAPTDKIFGPKANRHWLYKAVRRISEAAGVPVVSPHGLRGTVASVALEMGTIGNAVAAYLGQSSFEQMTVRHYATAESVTGARIDRVARLLQ